MKDKIFIFIIGFLVGAVISTGAFLIYTKVSSSNDNKQTEQMPGGNPPEMPEGEEPPEMPSDEKSKDSSSDSSKKDRSKKTSTNDTQSS